MDTPHTAALPRTANDFNAGNESAISAMSWAAILGGGVAAAALSLILLALGSGLGLSSISPWQGVGASATAVGIGTAIWLALMQLISSGFGGYLAGRLRTRWVGVHTDEVFFRDTAHGFLVWAVSVVVTAAWLASTAASLAGSAAVGATAVGAAAGVAATQAKPDGQQAYLTDRLLRTDAPTTSADDTQLRGEIGRTLANGMRDGSLAPDDRSYLARSIAAHSGISQADAEKRVDDAMAQAKATADTARKAAAYTSLWIFISLLIGAFSASYAATWGGRSRDRLAHP